MSRIKNILIPVDFSNASKRALRYACELADTFEATLHVLHVVEHPYLPGGYMEFYASAGTVLRSGGAGVPRAA